MLVIRGGQVYQANGTAFHEADILINQGRILKIGSNLALPSEAEIIDAQGLFITPGLVDAHSHIGGFGAGGDQDLNEMTAPITAEVEAINAVDPRSDDFEIVRRAGITTAAILPGSGNVIGGIAFVCKTAGKSIFEMCLKQPYALKMAMGGNPKSVYGKRNQMPMTRMGIAALIRESFEKAREYGRKKAEAEVKGETAPEFSKAYEHMLLALEGKIPVKVHSEQFDMLTVIQICEEFGLSFTLDHAWGSSDFYEEIASAKGLKGVIFGPIGVQLLPGECGKVDIHCLTELDRRGVLLAIMTDGPIMVPEALIMQCGEAVRQGFDPDRVLDLVTINAARILDVAERVGSLEVGKDADLVLFKGRPALDVAAHPVMTILNGEIVYRKD